jgi:dual specificity phosphatase 12
MKKVRDSLYIGNIKDAAEVLTSPNPPVTHMLSLITPNMDPLEYKKPAAAAACDEEEHHSPLEVVDVASVEVDKLVRKIVPIRDIESQNLLDHLEACLEFIEKGRSEGEILVHCVAGVSRSAAVITAYLMRLDRCTVDEALASLQQVSSKVYPNYGFMQQLQLFEEMGYVVDRRHRSFKKFHVENLGEAFGRGEKIESSRYAADPGVVTTNKSEEEDGVSSSSQQACYSCKKCKRVIAYQENVIPHDSMSGESSFRWRRRGSRRWGGEDDDPACTSLFVEPMQWMSTVQDGVYEGKLQCLNCEARLGSFNWAGIQCSCGTRVTPAFQLHKCHMDSSLT